MFQSILQVALGGAIGSSLRYLSNVGAMRWIGPGFPWATLFVNILGSFVMGVIVEDLAQRGGQTYAPFLMTGILGGFTTFSTFSLEVALLHSRGETAMAALYAAGSVALGVGALYLGMASVR